MNLWMNIIWLFVLLFSNSFFVGAEFAIVAARRSQIEPLAEKGDKRAKKALEAIEHMPAMLTCSQLGITICSLLILNVAEPAFIFMLKTLLSHFSLYESIVNSIAFITTLIFVTLFHIILGEIVPKNISISIANKAILWLAPPLIRMSKLLTPVIYILNWLGIFILKSINVKPKNSLSSSFTLEEMQSIVNQSKKYGTIIDINGLLTGVLKFPRCNVKDIMIPIDKVITIYEKITPKEFEKISCKTGYSRFPIENHQGKLIGYLHLKDILNEGSLNYKEPISNKKFRSLISIIFKAEIEIALESMQRTGSHLACVIDNDGNIIGVLFLEDVLEQLIGEISDINQNNKL